MDEADYGRLMTTIGVSGLMFFSGTGSPGLSRTISTEPCVCVCVFGNAYWPSKPYESEKKIKI